MMPILFSFDVNDVLAGKRLGAILNRIYSFIISNVEA